MKIPFRSRKKPDVKISDGQALETTRQFIMKTDAKLKTLKTIQKIYTGYYNTGQNTELFAEEFFYTIGEILKGKELKDLDLKYLNMKDILRKEQ